MEAINNENHNKIWTALNDIPCQNCQTISQSKNAVEVKQNKELFCRQARLKIGIKSYLSHAFHRKHISFFSVVYDAIVEKGFWDCNLLECHMLHMMNTEREINFRKKNFLGQDKIRQKTKK